MRQRALIRRLRVTHVITKGRPMGGAQMDTLALLKYQQSGYDVALVMGNEGPLGDLCRESHIPVEVVPIRNRLLDPLGDLLALIRLVRVFRQTRPDLVHTHTSKAGVLGRVAARLTGVPRVVHTVHIPPYHRGQPTGVRWLLTHTERIVSMMTDHVIAVAESLAADYVNTGICCPEKVTTIGSPIDFSAFPTDAVATRTRVRQQLRIPPDAPIIISVANLEPRKRHDVLIAAAGTVLHSGRDVWVLLVGTGELQDRLQRQVRQAGLDDRVILCGKREDVPDLLCASDVFVQTSQLEGLSRSLIEAMYAGLTIIATDANATRDLVRDGENGWLVPCANPDTLAGRIISVLDDPPGRSRLGEKARSAASEMWGVQAVGEAHDALYAALAGRGSGDNGEPPGSVPPGGSRVSQRPAIHRGCK